MRDDVRESRVDPQDELTRLLEQMPAGVVRLAADWTVTYVNHAAEVLTSRTREELVGRNLWESFPEAVGTPIEEAYRRGMQTGRDDSLQAYYAPLDAHVDIRIVPDATGLTLYNLDVSEHVRVRQDLDRALAAQRSALHAQQETAARLARVNAVTLRLAAAQTLQDLEEVVVGDGAEVLGSDGGAIVSQDENGAWRVTVSDALGESVQATYATMPFDSPFPGQWCARTGQRLLLPTRESGLAFHPSMATVYADTGRDGWAFLPLGVEDQRFGCLAVSWREEHSLADDELALLEGFAAQCAQTLHRVLGARARQAAALASQRMSETLQLSLLTQPTTAASVPIAVRYHPAALDAQVGGDWYDAFTNRTGTTLLAVGDITGHDRAAAAAMGQVRNLLRGIAWDSTDSPAVLLARLDGAVRGLELHALATAVLARLEQDDAERAAGVWRLCWSNAGHPPPLVLGPDGGVRLLETEPDRLLGVDPDVHRADHHVTLRPGELVLLYTDGLVERRRADLDQGTDWLAGAVAGLAHLDPDQLCDHLLTLVAGHTGDDVALLALRIPDRDTAVVAPGPPSDAWTAQPLPTMEGVVWWWDVRGPQQLSTIRAAIRQRLDRHPQTPSADTAAGDALLLAVEELTSNALRHGVPPVRTSITVTDSDWLLDVSDGAGDQPPARAVGRDPALGGLGLQLTAALATAHGWMTSGTRKHVWARVPFHPADD